MPCRPGSCSSGNGIAGSSSFPGTSRFSRGDSFGLIPERRFQPFHLLISPSKSEECDGRMECHWRIDQLGSSFSIRCCLLRYSNQSSPDGQDRGSNAPTHGVCPSEE